MTALCQYKFSDDGSLCNQPESWESHKWRHAFVAASPVWTEAPARFADGISELTDRLKVANAVAASPVPESPRCVCGKTWAAHNEDEGGCDPKYAPESTGAQETVTLHRINYESGPNGWGECVGEKCGIRHLSIAEHAVATITRREP